MGGRCLQWPESGEDELVRPFCCVNAAARNLLRRLAAVPWVFLLYYWEEVSMVGQGSSGVGCAGR